MKRPRFLPDNFLLAIIGMIILATFFPAHGKAVPILSKTTDFAIALLFYLHGTRLSKEAVIAGILHWRLHIIIFLSTFVLFPIVGLIFKPLYEPLLGTELTMGILFICALPSTVQSSIAFTAVARGNIPAAICSASFSNLLGIFLTPILVGLMFSVHGQGNAFSLEAVYKIVVMLLLPFMVGQLTRHVVGSWVNKNKAWLKYVDQTSILLVVYGAFSDAVIGGIWGQLSIPLLLTLCVVSVLLLFIVLFSLMFISRKIGFNTEDEIAVIFCGSKKSLATGVPIAQILFAGHPVGMLILPLMVFHQIQLMVAAVMAQRYAMRPKLAEK